MQRFHFRVQGFDEKKLRKLTQQTSLAAKPLLWTLVAVTGLYALGALGPGTPDQYGNPEGDKYDLVRDHVFEGFTIAVLHLYTGEGFDFSLPQKALQKKGFKIQRWTSPPTANELADALETACQLWLISSDTQQLSSQHLSVIKDFFANGGGLYIWGDNQPYYADANYVASELFGVTMAGNTTGQQVIGPQANADSAGFIRHPIMTGIRHLYEGHTVATIQATPQLEPLIYGSAGNLIVATYDRNGKKAIIDGAFTRLYTGWDSAGSVRYVQNAAAWLVKN